MDNNGQNLRIKKIALKMNEITEPSSIYFGFICYNTCVLNSDYIDLCVGPFVSFLILVHKLINPRYFILSIYIILSLQTKI